MRLYLDTEFNGFGGELISLTLVSKTEQWYQAKTFHGPIDSWVKENVLPKLNTHPMQPFEFKASLHKFLKTFDNPEIVCDWHADAAHFCGLLSGEDYGSSLDFACGVIILKTPPGQPRPLMPHNALSDAIALMEWDQGR